MEIMMLRHRLLNFFGVIAVALVAGLAGWMSLPAQADAPSLPQQDDYNAGVIMNSLEAAMPASSDSADVLLARATDAGRIPVIVTLNLPAFQPDSDLTPAQAQVQRNTIASTQSSVLSSLSEGSFAVNSRYKYIPAMALTVDASAVEALLNNPQVEFVREDVPEPPTMTSSLQVINATTPGGSFDQGMMGNGWGVAILDTGVQYDHPMFAKVGGGTRVTHGACFNTNSTAPDYTATTRCPNGLQDDTSGPAAGDDCNSSLAVGCEHGTHVAGSAAGDNGGHGVGQLYGVAPEADIISVNVFSLFSGGSSGNICQNFYGQNSCVLTFTGDQLDGLDYVYDLVVNQNVQVAAANMSLGGGYYTSTCDGAQPSRKLAIDNLISVDVATVIASGNSSFRDGMGAPACISTSVSVGATDDSDNVASFSNVASFLDIYAPGVSIESSTVPNAYSFYNGTSMSTPHVAGAFAAMRSRFPTASIATLESIMKSTGTPVNDNRSGGTVTNIPRLDIGAAVAIDADVNTDGLISPTDAVYVINRLNSGDLSADVDGDGDVDTDDVILVLNRLGN
jgi:hypothetical protein